MNINSAFGNAVAGIQQGMRGLDRNASEIAGAARGEGQDIAQPLVESREHKLQVEASARMVSTIDETIGSLLDEMA